MTAKARYVRKDSTIYRDSHCLYCGACYGIGKGEARACRTTVCLACGTVQCMVNGLSNGQCKICYAGLLPGWAGSNPGQCTYKGCTNTAVARGRDRKQICLAHLEHQQPGFLNRVLADRDAHWLLKPDTEVPAL